VSKGHYELANAPLLTWPEYVETEVRRPRGDTETRMVGTGQVTEGTGPERIVEVNVESQTGTLVGRVWLAQGRNYVRCRESHIPMLISSKPGLRARVVDPTETEAA
jgi:hypothetical protein